MLYRKHKDQDSVWHFHEGCRGWPRSDYAEVHAPILDESERLCTECVKLESPIYNHISSKYFLQGLAYSVHAEAKNPKAKKSR
jgi:hypothetical protein